MPNWNEDLHLWDSDRDRWNEDLFHRYSGRLFAFARKSGHTQEDSEDMVQEFFTEIFGNPTLKQQVCDATPGWLFNRFRWRMVDHFKKKHGRTEEQRREGSAKNPTRMTVEDCPGPYENEPFTAAVAAELEEAVRVMLQSLTELERQVVILKLYYDYTWGEISNETSRTESACMYAYTRAKTKLKNAFKFKGNSV